MPDQPECPYPKKCPMETEEFNRRMAEIEATLKAHTAELSDNREKRHDRNQHINQVIDQETIARLKLEDRVKEQEVSIDELKTMHRELIDVLRGSWGRAGVVEEQSSHGRRIQALEEWKTNIRSFVGGAVFVGSAVGAVLGFILNLIFSK